MISALWWSWVGRGQGYLVAYSLDGNQSDARKRHGWVVGRGNEISAWLFSWVYIQCRQEYTFSTFARRIKSWWDSRTTIRQRGACTTAIAPGMAQQVPVWNPGSPVRFSVWISRGTRPAYFDFIRRSLVKRSYCSAACAEWVHGGAGFAGSSHPQPCLFKMPDLWSPSSWTSKPIAQVACLLYTRTHRWS